ncbi:MAG TPA: peptidoglycan bridge formation glycyltransferase FemA/FemB family protein [Candidatus Eisenbacteria bacterium]|nr:peptidoglycan bridge formation glycyltransferase FemA/FemB family protein [Candidatus Eisenbacteria bacterium]
MLKIQEIINKKTWEEFIEKVSNGFPPFFQTWNWGDVQKRQGIKIWRLGLYKNTSLIGIVSVTYISAKRGKYIHLRHGPVLKEYKKEYLDFLMKFLSEKGKKAGASFIRLSPLISEEEGKSLFVSSEFRNAQIHAMDAEVCWILPLDASEEEILKNMRKSHRYLIRKSQTTGVVIERTKNIDKMKLFLPLYTKLAHKKHFVAHHGVEEELEIFGKDDQSLLFLAHYENKVIAGALIDFVHGMAIYRHSASDDAYRHIPAMYLLQWEVIKEAKKRDMKLYNFWGIAPGDSKRHPWHGITLFKTGFGGEKKEFMHGKDYVLSWKYWLIYALERVTKLRKGY